MDCTTQHVADFVLFLAQVPAIAAGLWVFLRLEKRATDKYGSDFGSNGNMKLGAPLILGVITWAVVVDIMLNILSSSVCG